MLPRSVLAPILRDESLTRHLNDPEARILVEWLVERAERGAETSGDPLGFVGRLLRRGRALARFVSLWSNPRDRGAACQLAASEQFAWPLPKGSIDACELMQTVIAWEEHYARTFTRT